MSSYAKSMYNRNGSKWTINECIKLQREYELLKLSVKQIAKLHQRTPNAILFKLYNEGIVNYNDRFYNKHTYFVDEDNSVNEGDSVNEGNSDNDDSVYEDDSDNDDSYNDDSDNDESVNEDSVNEDDSVNKLTIEDYYSTISRLEEKINFLVEHALKTK